MPSSCSTAWPWTASAQDQSTEAPARPTGLTGTVSHDAVALTWDNPQDSTITGYQILRRDKSIHELGEFIVHVEDTGDNAPSYTDTNVVAEGRYTYRVKARNEGGLSPQSSYFDARLPQPPAVTVSFAQATYAVGEGDNVAVAVVLGADPERTVNIPIVSPPIKTTLPTQITRASHQRSPSNPERPGRLSP